MCVLAVEDNHFRCILNEVILPSSSLNLFVFLISSYFFFQNNRNHYGGLQLELNVGQGILQGGAGTVRGNVRAGTIANRGFCLLLVFLVCLHL